MDSPQISPTNLQPTTSQTPANLNTPELPKAPEKLLSPPNGNSWGAILGIVIIVLMLIVGALYFWGAKLSEEKPSAASPASAVSIP